MEYYELLKATVIWTFFFHKNTFLLKWKKTKLKKKKSVKERTPTLRIKLNKFKITQILVLVSEFKLIFK